MRIADYSMQSLVNRMLDRSRSRLQESEIQAASGKKYRFRSDAPTETAKAAAARTKQSCLSTWQENVDVATTWCQVTESNITQAVENLQRAKEITVQARDAVLPDEDRASLAIEIDSLLESMVQVANSKHGDAYLLGGMDSSQAPVTVSRDANGSISAVTVTDTGDRRRRQIQAGPESLVSYGARTIGETDGLFVRPDGSGGDTVNVFQTLIDVRTSLQAADMPTDQAVAELGEALDNATLRLAENGIDQTRLNALATRLVKDDDTLNEELYDLEEADQAKVLTELARQEAVLTAALQVAARLNNISLADYI